MTANAKRARTAAVGQSPAERLPPSTRPAPPKRHPLLLALSAAALLSWLAFLAWLALFV